MPSRPAACPIDQPACFRSCSSVVGSIATAGTVLVGEIVRSSLGPAGEPWIAQKKDRSLGGSGPFFVFASSSSSSSSGSLPSRGDRDVWRREAGEGERVRPAVERRTPGMEFGRPVRIRAGLREIEIPGLLTAQAPAAAHFSMISPCPHSRPRRSSRGIRRRCPRGSGSRRRPSRSQSRAHPRSCCRRQRARTRYT